MSKPWLVVETHHSQPIDLGSDSATLVARSLRVGLPVWNIVFFWHRPIGVSVIRPEGAPRWIPVYDVTRLAEFVLLVAVCVALLLAWQASSRAGSRGLTIRKLVD